MLDTIFTVVFLFIAYASFRLYFTWAYFEPIVPEAFPKTRAIRFEALICTVMIFVHMAAHNAGATLLAQGCFWVCAGSVIGHGILPPTHQSSSEGFFKGLLLAFWQDRLGSIVVGAIVSLLTWLLVPNSLKVDLGDVWPLAAALYCVFIVSTLKGLAALGMRRENDVVLA